MTSHCGLLFLIMRMCAYRNYGLDVVHAAI